MARYKLCTREPAPALELEAANEDEAKDKAREELHDWADQVELDADCEEPG